MLKGRRVLRSTAPSKQPKTTENSLNSEFSTVWTNSFHCVEKRRKVFPLCGKIGLFFPQCGNFFPLCGKIAKKFSIVWKNSVVTEPDALPDRKTVLLDRLDPRHEAGRRSVWGGEVPRHKNPACKPLFSGRIIQLAIWTIFWESFGSSEMIHVRTCSLRNQIYCVLRSHRFA